MDQGQNQGRGNLGIVCNCNLCSSNYDYSERLGKFSSYVTGTNFDIAIRNDNNLPPCELDCVIYLISCSNCNMQYVGKTKNKLKRRVYGHKQSCKKKKDQIMYKHFNSDCGFEHAKFRIIDRTTENDLMSREDYWMKKLMTVYPFGFNDQVREIGNMTRQNFVNFDFIDPFFRYPETRRHRSHGIRSNKKKTQVKVEDVIEDLKFMYNNYEIKRCIDTIKGTNKNLLNKILETIILSSDQLDKRLVDIISAYVGHSRKYSEISKLNNNNDNIRVQLEYSSKIIDHINIQSLLSSNRIRSKIPHNYKENKIEIIHKYNKPIGNHICNYNKFLENLTEQDILNNNRCICERNDSNRRMGEFIYAPVSHVITGNLNILDKLGNYNQLKQVMKYGYKYRMQEQNVTWTKIKRDILNTIGNIKNRLINKNNGNNNDLTEWENTLKRMLNNKIRSLQNTYNLKTFEFGVDFGILKKQIENVHKHFVITTIDKASNNFAFICKKFYINQMKNELGIRNNRVEGNDVYTYCENTSMEEIIEEQCDNLERFHKQINVNNRKIPKLFMNPKFHKRPYKYRFIAGASKATTKELSIDVNLCLKLMKKVHKGYCKSIFNRTGFNYYWSVDNSNEVIDKLRNINNHSAIHTYDFSTLYTNLPLELVRDEIFELIDRYFDINERKGDKYITVNHYLKKSSFSSSNNRNSFSREKLKEAIEYLLFNSYVRFGPYVFKQTKGIPMGGNASPLIADLFLANLEFKYMKKLVDTKQNDNNYNRNIRLARKLSNNSRYIDDILVCGMIDINEFIQYSLEIYPDSIPLTAGNANHLKDTFLDIDIQIEDNNLNTKIYHKIDDFDFEVVSFPFPTSNISDYITYNSFYSQLVRYASICSKFEYFAARCKRLADCLILRGYKKHKFKRNFKNFLANYYDVLRLKYDIDTMKRFYNTQM